MENHRVCVCIWSGVEIVCAAIIITRAADWSRVRDFAGSLSLTREREKRERRLLTQFSRTSAKWRARVSRSRHLRVQVSRPKISRVSLFTAYLSFYSWNIRRNNVAILFSFTCSRYRDRQSDYRNLNDHIVRCKMTFNREKFDLCVIYFLRDQNCSKNGNIFAKYIYSILYIFYLIFYILHNTY